MRYIWIIVLLALMAFAVPCYCSRFISAPNPQYQGPAEGDPIWNPSEQQLAAWALDGINAAAAGMYLADVPGVAGWSWSGDTPMGGGRRLRWAFGLAPKLVATAAGFEIAWHDDAFARIQNGEAGAVAAEIAAAVKRDWIPGQLRAMFGCSGPPGSLRVAFYQRMWTGDTRVLQTQEMHSSYGEARTGPASAEWAGKYVAAQAGLTGTVVTLMAHPQNAYFDPSAFVASPDPDDNFIAAIGTPKVANDTLRWFLGDPNEWAFVEWKM